MDVKVVAVLQVVQECKKMVDRKVEEVHLLKQDLVNFLEAAEQDQLQVHEISQQFEDFKTKTTEYTLST